MPESQNVRVCCKLRPQSKIEDGKGSTLCVSSTPTTIDITTDTGPNKFTFDRVFSPETNQEEVFQEVGVSLVDNLLAGFNCTLFAYGQSGSGKTFTMEGPQHHGEMAGLIPRIVSAIFEKIQAKTKESNGGLSFAVKVSYVEIYNEKIRDLLDTTRQKCNLQVRQDKVKGVYVEGVTEEFADSGEVALAIMDKGSKMRATASTGMNDTSSRSHSVLQVSVIQDDHAAEVEVSSRMTLIDLAGSETVKKTGAQGAQMEEAKAINKSLSALGQVIKAITDPNATHIPFRDSKLTRMLQEAIGGNSRTTLMICCSPSKYNSEETVSTCRFGARAKAITNKAVVNELRSAKELERLLKQAQSQIKIHRLQVARCVGLLQEHNIKCDFDFDTLSALPGDGIGSRGKTSGGSGRKRAPMLAAMAIRGSKNEQESSSESLFGDDGDANAHYDDNGNENDGDDFRNSFWVKDSADSDDLGDMLMTHRNSLGTNALAAEFAGAGGGAVTATAMAAEVAKIKVEKERVEAEKLVVEESLAKEQAERAAVAAAKAEVESQLLDSQEAASKAVSEVEELQEQFEQEEQMLRQQLVTKQNELHRLEGSKEASRLLEAENEKERLLMEQSRAHLQCKELKKTLEKTALAHKLALRDSKLQQQKEAKVQVASAVKDARKAGERVRELESHCAVAKTEAREARRDKEKLSSTVLHLSEQLKTIKAQLKWEHTTDLAEANRASSILESHSSQSNKTPFSKPSSGRSNSARELHRSSTMGSTSIYSSASVHSSARRGGRPSALLKMKRQDSAKIEVHLTDKAKRVGTREVKEKVVKQVVSGSGKASKSKCKPKPSTSRSARSPAKRSTATAAAAKGQVRQKAAKLSTVKP